jgi:hypothetical protein
MSATTDRDPGPCAGAEDHAEHHPATLTSAVDGLRHREAVRVVSGPDVAAQRLAEIGLRLLAVQPGRGCALGDPRPRIQRARQTDADAALLAGAQLDLRNQLDDGPQTTGVVRPGGVGSTTSDLLAGVGKPDRFDLGASPVDADPHPSTLHPTPALEHTGSRPDSMPRPWHRSVPPRVAQVWRRELKSRRVVR